MELTSKNYFTRRQIRSQTRMLPPLALTQDKLRLSRQNFVTAYLVLKNTNRDYLETLANLFTTQHTVFESHVTSHPLFFKLDEAKQYLNFLGDNPIILKAVVPQTAVEGRFETLHVKPQQLSLRHIYGGYTSEEANHFVVNPRFDASMLPFVKPYTVYDE